MDLSGVGSALDMHWTSHTIDEMTLLDQVGDNEESAATIIGRKGEEKQAKAAQMKDNNDGLAEAPLQR
jgi:hypothetical protein